MARNVEDIRNIAVCGHGSSGKTTLVDQLLVKTGAVSGQPSVDAGTSICDFDEEEKHHKHSIEASCVHFDHAGKRFNVIDTPGYPDFIGQTIGALRAVETALIAIDAHAGIKVNTRRVWQEAGEAGLGRIIVHHQAGHRQHQLPAARRLDPRSVRQRAACCSTCRSGRGTISRAWSARSTRPADVGGADRSGKRQRSR